VEAVNFETYIERSRVIDSASIPAKARTELFQRLEDGMGLPELVRDHRALVESLPRTHVHRLLEARIEWRERERAVVRLLETFKRSGLPEPPPAVLERALVPHKVSSIERAARIAPRSDFADADAWGEALGGLSDLWSGAVNLTLRRGSVRVKLKASHPDVRQFEDLAKRAEALSELPTHRWQAIRRGQRLGVLDIAFEPPLSSIRGHLDGIRSKLGPTAGGREPASLLDEMVFDHLSPALVVLLDRKAEDDAIRAAVSQYQKLLTGAPLAAGRIGSVYLSGDGRFVGVIVVSEGELPELQEEVVTDEGFADAVEAFLSVAGVEQVAVPMTTPQAEVFAVLKKKLEETYELLPVRVAAVAEARAELMAAPLELPRSIASALVLARRALQPADEWERVDPVALGLADYQQDLDEERLREALLEALGLFQLDRATGAFVSPPAKLSARVLNAPPPPRLNPTLKALTDLRPGMTVEGIITNITRFGAFVNLGLPEEGMIHISELSLEYVQSPSDVVAIGDRVNARVLDVEPNKRRIALSLKPSPGGPSAERRGGLPLDAKPGFARSALGGGPRSVGRAQALQELENLFKK
jgi:transcriptional accessory protein Tex/SPT6